MVLSRVLCKRLVFFLADRPSGSLNRISSQIVFPPEPPVATAFGWNGAQRAKGALVSGAAQRTLAGEHRSGIGLLSGRADSGENTISRDSRWWALSESGRFAESSFDPIAP
jgi:hypothetical protein